MTNNEIAAIFTDIAEMLRLKKDNIFKIRAYEKVARSISELKEPVEKLVTENRLKEVPGVGEAIGGSCDGGREVSSGGCRSREVWRRRFQ